VSAALQISGLHAGYAGVRVLRGVDLEVEAGEVVALLGANGAGKTTALLAAAGVLPILEGDVLVLGKSVRGARTHEIARRGLALVPDDRGLFSQLTVRENLRLGRRRRDPDRREALVDFPALEDLLDRRVGLLSGGEQQMLALAKALGAQPRVLMIDELSLGLAPVALERLLPAVRRLAEEAGVAVLLVEQHVRIALMVADRVYVLKRGEIAFAGPTDELIARGDLLEASYLGHAVAAGEST
jgi:branched-chain amino acid transport system ATP-binding protein